MLSQEAVSAAAAELSTQRPISSLVTSQLILTLAQRLPTTQRNCRLSSPFNSARRPPRKSPRRRLWRFAAPVDSGASLREAVHGPRTVDGKQQMSSEGGADDGASGRRSPRGLDAIGDWPLHDRRAMRTASTADATPGQPSAPCARGLVGHCHRYWQRRRRRRRRGLSRASRH